MASLGFRKYEPQEMSVPKDNIIFFSSNDDTDEFRILKDKLHFFNIPLSEIFEFAIKSTYVPVTQDIGEPLMSL